MAVSLFRYYATWWLNTATVLPDPVGACIKKLLSDSRCFFKIMDCDKYLSLGIVIYISFVVCGSCKSYMFFLKFFIFLLFLLYCFFPLFNLVFKGMSFEVIATHKNN
jgi:hypothetical protein